MLLLKTFGGLSVDVDGTPGTGAGQQRKTLALLALLAAAGRRGVSRDKLAAFLWPESDTEHARSLLKQACYALRRDLHAPELFLGATELRLNPAVITSDIQAFEHAVEGGDPERAAVVYAGRFLDGFYLGAAGEFERWMEDERSRLEQRAIGALEWLATQAASADDVKAALKWWRRLTELDPFSAQAALGLMRTLDDAGERAEAVQHGRWYGAYVRQELGVEPAAAVLALIQELHHQTGEGARRSPARAVAVEPPSVKPARGPLRSGGLGWRPALAAAAIVLMGGMVIVVAHSRKSPLDPELIAVAPFGILDPQFELWHEGLVDVLSRNLDGAGPFRSLSPTVVIRRWKGRADRASAEDLARRTGAGVVLFGQLSSVGTDSVRLRAVVLDARNERTIAEIDRIDRADRIDRLADSLSLDVIRTLAATTPGIRIRLFAVGTRSFPALKAFLQGERLFRRFALDSAIVSYDRAVAIDSTFALALRRLGLARGWRGQSGQSLGLRAGRSNHGLAPRDSLLIVADSLEAASDDPLDDAYWSHRVRKLSTLEEASRRYPDDPEVWYTLGEARFHLGYAVGSTAGQTLDAFDRVIALDSAFAPAYVHPVQLALDRNDTASAKNYIRGYVGLTSGVPEGAGMRLVGLLVDSVDVKSAELQRIIDTASANVLFDAWRSVQRWPDASEAGARLLRVLASGRRGIGLPADTATTRYLLATELLYRGHLREASRLIGSRFSVPYGELAVLGIGPADSATVAFDRWLRSPNERAVVADPPWVTRCYRSFLAAGWWVRRQDTVPLLNLMRRGDSVARSAGTVVKLVDARADANLARAALALARRDTAEALRRFLALPDSLCSAQYGSLAPSLAPLHMVRFELLAATGRDREAALLFDQQITVPLTTGSVLAALERGHIAERLGDRATAVKHYRFVVAVWANADPELRPHVEAARVGIQRLGAAVR